MSVINKVLRDLDKRQGAATAPTDTGQGVRQGTASIEVQGATPRVHRVPAAAVRWGALGWPALVLVLVGGGVTLWQSGALQQRELPVPAVSATSAPPTNMPVVPQKPDALTDTTPTRQTTQSEVASASRFESQLVITKDLKPATAPQAVPATAFPPVKINTQVAPPPPAAAETSQTAVTAAVTPTAAVPAPAPAELAQKQQLAARDALAQAQALWNAGSRDAAVDLLQQAVASTERTAQTAPGAGTTQTLVLLVRELGRMQLAEGRPGVVWDTLTRNEPLLRNEPEMWALRANAAQRLGQHQDSVHAYMTALQSRPNEQRWVLGTAVSLAALGQTTGAAEMAERARTLGPISREVQTYLRQMGVPVKDL